MLAGAEVYLYARRDLHATQGPSAGDPGRRLPGHPGWMHLVAIWFSRVRGRSHLRWLEWWAEAPT